MNKELYEMIFKRKTFHLFRNIGDEHITYDEIKDIEDQFAKFKPLVDDISSKYRLFRRAIRFVSCF